MALWLGVCAVLLFFTALILLIKLLGIKRSVREMTQAFISRRFEHSNVLIDLSSRDRDLRRLADQINRQLRRLRKLRRRYEQGDRELKEAITNISHDLRTPLTAICGYLDLLQRQPQSAKTKAYLERIASCSERLKTLTEELFGYSLASLAGSGERRRVAVNHVLEESLLAFYEAMQRRQITPVIHLPEVPVERWLCAADLSRVFENILANALKYSDGDLQVVMDERGQIVFTNTAKSLNPLLAARLFDRFYTVETGRHTTGLGLAIARELTGRMGGTIRAEYQDEKLSLILIFPAEESKDDGG